MRLSADDIPLRTAPEHLVGPAPLTFAQLEQEYFNVPGRNFSDMNDINTKRQKWLADLGLEDSLFQKISQSSDHQIAVEMVYEDKPILERRAVEAKARYLKVMLVFTDIPCAEFEAKYEIYPRSAFHIHTHWGRKRTEWTKLLGLFYSPFSYIKIAPTHAEKQALDSAWAEKSSAERKLIEERATEVKESSNLLFQQWHEVEAVFGHSEDKDTYFRNKTAPAYSTMRQLWLEAIGMAVAPYSGSYPDQATMDGHWAAKGVEEKKVVLNKARAERERFVRVRKREEQAKQSGNYKPPEKKPAKKGSTNGVSKPCRNGYSYGYSPSRYPGSGRSSWNNGQDRIISTAIITLAWKARKLTPVLSARVISFQALSDHVDYISRSRVTWFRNSCHWVYL